MRKIGWVTPDFPNARQYNALRCLEAAGKQGLVLKEDKWERDEKNAEKDKLIEKGINEFDDLISFRSTSPSYKIDAEELDRLVGCGWLAKDKHHRYTLTEKGKKAFAALVTLAEE